MTPHLRANVAEVGQEAVARKLGLAISPGLLAQVDDVIELEIQGSTR